MRITFIGTSHGVPEPSRKCSCALVEIADKKYLIDAGCDPMSAMIDRGIDPALLTAVFVTHAHSDHTNGLIPLVSLCSWFFKKTDPAIYLPEMRIKDGINAYLASIHDEIREGLRFYEIQEGVFYDDGTLRVTAMRTGHAVGTLSVAYAFKLEAEGKKVLFTGDMEIDKGPVTDYARYTAEDTFDLVVAECAHFPADLYLEPIRKNPPKRFCFNHYSWRHEESCHRVRAALWGEVPVTLVKDDYQVVG